MGRNLTVLPVTVSTTLTPARPATQARRWPGMKAMEVTGPAAANVYVSAHSPCSGLHDVHVAVVGAACPSCCAARAGCHGLGSVRRCDSLHHSLVAVWMPISRLLSSKAT